MAKGTDETSLFEKIKSVLSWKLYDFKIKLRGKFPRKGKKEKTLSSIDRADAVFCAVILAIPLLQFVLFYVLVNFNSLLLAFQRIEGGEKSFVWFDNFSYLFRDFFRGEFFGLLLKNSLLSYFFLTVLSTPFALLFSFYIYKKGPLGNFFKIMLFLPSVITSIILVIIYIAFVDVGVPYLSEALFGHKVSMLYSGVSDKNSFGAVLFYTVFVSFGTTVLMYLSAMNSINESLVEAAALEGAGYFQEFVHITFPLIYPTFTTFFVVGIAAIFTNNMNLISFMGTENPKHPNIQTFGYYIYQQTTRGEDRYPEIAALGILMTIVVAPLTIGVKRLMEKYGPSMGE